MDNHEAYHPSDSARNGKNQFLSNQLFIEWQLFQTDELNTYWATFMSSHPDQVHELNSAIAIFKNIRFNDQKLTLKQKEELFDRITVPVDEKFAIPPKNHIPRYIYFAIAAIVILACIALPFKFFLGSKQNFQHKLVVATIKPSSDIQLVTSGHIVKVKGNASVLMAAHGTSYIAEKVNNHTQKINIGDKTSAVSMNKLIVPFGRRSELTLSDGSKIWVNAGTTLKFPSKFVSENREITVDGEIYLEVAKDKNHPFIVHTQSFDVQVYGTRFDVATYANYAQKSVVLVSGKVEVNKSGSKHILQPGMQYTLAANDEKLSNVDADKLIAWKNGLLVLDKTPVSEMLMKLGQYYNIDFKVQNPQLQLKTCSGNLYLSDDINQVMTVVANLIRTKVHRNQNTFYFGK